AGAVGIRVLLDPCGIFTSFAGHETGHALGLGHSFSTDTTYFNNAYASAGEYDDELDVMSCQNCLGRTTTRFSPGPPALIGPYSTGSAGSRGRGCSRSGQTGPRAARSP